jgi:hypothetical protein
VEVKVELPIVLGDCEMLIPTRVAWRPLLLQDAPVVERLSQAMARRPAGHEELLPPVPAVPAPDFSGDLLRRIRRSFGLVGDVA